MQVGEVNPSQWLSETAPWPLSAAPSGRAARRQVPASSRSARAPISAALAPRNETAVLPCPREPTERSAARVTARCPRAACCNCQLVGLLDACILAALAAQ
jgi:hypothetical protein